MKKILSLALSTFAFASVSAQFIYSPNIPDTVRFNYQNGSVLQYLSTDIRNIDFSDSKKVIVNTYDGQSTSIYRTSLENIRFYNRNNNPRVLLTEQQYGAYETLFMTNDNYTSSFYFLSCLASDEMFGGGGINDSWAGFDYLRDDLNLFSQYESATYSAVAQINKLIRHIDQTAGNLDQKEVDHAKGEMLFLRAYHHYELASLFEKIQVVTDNDSWEQRVKTFTPEEIWGQIMLDLKNAIGLMDGSLCPSLKEDGRVSRYAAEAMLARAFLFYTGFYQGKHDIANQDASVTLADGSTLTKQQVIDYLVECISQSPFYLVDDFRNIWPYTNRFTVESNPETANQGLKWVEDDWAINPEVLFKIRYNNKATWSFSYGSGYANKYALAFGHRNLGQYDYEKSFPIGSGWGAATVAPNLYQDWEESEPNDMRRQASIMDISQNIQDFANIANDAVQLTNYHEKKNSSILGKRDKYYPDEYNVFELWMFYENEMSSISNDMWSSMHPLNLIRLSDVLLMHSELTGTTDGINQVRQRAGLQPIETYTLYALQQERRWELAFEGVRWNDMRRWGDEYCMQALDRQLNQDIYYRKQNEKNNGGLFGYGNYSTQYAQTHGFFKTTSESVECKDAYYALTGQWTYGDVNGYTAGTIKYNGTTAEDFINHQEGLITGYTFEQLQQLASANDAKISPYDRMEINGNEILMINALGETLAHGTITLHETDNYDWRICSATVSNGAILGSNGCTEFDIINLDDKLILVDASAGATNSPAQFWVFRKSNSTDMLMYKIGNKKWSYAVAKSTIYDQNYNIIGDGYAGTWGTGGWFGTGGISVPLLYCRQFDGVLPQDLTAQATRWGLDTRDTDPYAYMVFNLQDVTVSKYTGDNQFITTGSFEVTNNGSITIHNNASLFPYSFYGEGDTVETFNLRHNDIEYGLVDQYSELLTMQEVSNDSQFTFWMLGLRGYKEDELADALIINQFDKNNEPAQDGCYFQVSFADGRRRDCGIECVDGTEILLSDGYYRVKAERGTMCEKELRFWIVNCNNDTVSVTRTLTMNMDLRPLNQIVIYDDPVGVTAGAWDSAPLRFSDYEGKYFPTITDQQYTELIDNNLHVVIKDAAEGTTMRVMNGWWSDVYYDNVTVSTGDDWQFMVTEQMAYDCMRGGNGKDLNLLVTSGQVTISKVYYELER